MNRTELSNPTHRAGAPGRRALPRHTRERARLLMGAVAAVVAGGLGVPSQVHANGLSATVTSVSVVGDSLVAGREEVYSASLRRRGVDALVDGRGSRALRWGWQCRHTDGSLRVFPRPTNEKCRREGLELLRQWRREQTLGEGVVIALGTNDAGLFRPSQAKGNLSLARELVGERPMWIVTVRKLRPSTKVTAWNDAAREWCAADVACEVIEWAESTAGRARSSYAGDGVHLTEAGARARAVFIAEAVATDG